MESRFARRNDDDDDDIFIVSETAGTQATAKQVKPEPTTSRSVQSPHSSASQMSSQGDSYPFNPAPWTRRPGLLPTPAQQYQTGPMTNQVPEPGQWMGHYPPPQRQPDLQSFHQRPFAKAPFHSQIGVPVAMRNQQANLPPDRPTDPRQKRQDCAIASTSIKQVDSHEIKSPRASTLTQIQTVPEKLRAMVDTLFKRQPSLGSSTIADVANCVSNKQEDKIDKFMKQVKPVINQMRKECKDLNNSSIEHETTLDEYYAILPPLETFMRIGIQERSSAFYKQLEVGDILVGEIDRKSETGFLLTALCCDKGKRRDLTGLDIELYCPYSQAISAEKYIKIAESYSIKDIVRVLVTDRIPIQSKISVSMKSDSLSKDIQENFKLGLMNEEEMPVHYKRTKMMDGRSFHACLNEILTFSNPAGPEYLLKNLVQPLERRHLSLMKSLQSKVYDEKEMAVSLKKTQSARWASKSVQMGVQFLKQGKSLEAHQAITKALQIDPENVDAFVTRGCLHANSGNLKKGLEDFEHSLKLNPSHANAKKYCVETLIALGSKFEDENDYQEAEKMYRKVLKLDSKNSVVKESLDKLVKKMKNLSPKKKSNSKPNKIETPSNNEVSYESLTNPERPTSLTDTQEKLLSLLKSESGSSSSKKKKVKKDKKKKKSSKKQKKKRHHSSSSESSDHDSDSSSSSSSPSSDSSSESDSSSDSGRKSKKKHKKKNKRSRHSDTPVIDLSSSPNKQKETHFKRSPEIGSKQARDKLATHPVPAAQVLPPMAGLVPLYQPVPDEMSSDRYALDHTLNHPSLSNSTVRPSVERVLRERREEETFLQRRSGGIPGLDILDDRRSRSPFHSLPPRHSYPGSFDRPPSRGHPSSRYYPTRGYDDIADHVRGGHRPPPRFRSRSPRRFRTSPRPSRSRTPPRRSRSRTPPRIIDHRRSEGDRFRDRFGSSRGYGRGRGSGRGRFISYTAEAIAQRDREELDDIAKIFGFNR